jgi:hypothetical protein
MRSCVLTDTCEPPQQTVSMLPHVACCLLLRAGAGAAADCATVLYSCCLLCDAA